MSLERALPGPDRIRAGHRRTTLREAAAAFSDHRFAEAYDHLSPDVRWVTWGMAPLVGHDAVVAACEDALLHTDPLRVQRHRFLVVCDGDAATVDALTSYTDRTGEVLTVASCDVYERGPDGLVASITSYATEVDPVTARILG